MFNVQANGTQDNDSDRSTSVEENDNMFHANYRQMKENPLYSSNPDLRRSSARPVGSSPHSDSPPDDEVDAPTRRPRQQRPNYNEV